MHKNAQPTQMEFPITSDLHGPKQLVCILFNYLGSSNDFHDPNEVNWLLISWNHHVGHTESGFLKFCFAVNYYKNISEL